MKRVARSSGGPAPANPAAASEGHAVPAAYPTRISLYTEPPAYEITLEEFEELAVARLQLLRAVETALVRNLRDDELAKYVGAAEQRWHLQLHSNEGAAVYALEEERRRDQGSHFVLRLAFCTNGEAQRWLVTHETALLKYRFAACSTRERTEFLQTVAALGGSVLCERTDAQLEAMLRCSTVVAKDVGSEDVFKIPFEQVPDLVARRAVLVRGGWAHVPRSESFSVVVTRFRDNLERQLERTAKELPLLRDDRLVPLLELVTRSDAEATPRGCIDRSAPLAAADIDRAAVHFPLCMQQLHQRLRRDSHLKHGGRQQYGLFLKSIGVPLEEALLFWRRAFSPRTSDELFQRNYAYNIRHNYGLEGKRANYAPYSCAKIITSSDASGEAGCPFRHAGSNAALASLLSSYEAPGGGRLGAQQTQELLELVKGHHYQIACTKLHEYTRPPNPAIMETITYPSQFYAASLAPSRSDKNS